MSFGAMLFKSLAWAPISWLLDSPMLLTQLQQPEFSVFCSSNMDGTGRCTRDDTDESLSCLVIPGGVIACRDKQKIRYECVQYGAILAHQTQFSCSRSAGNRLGDQLIDQPPLNTAPSAPLEVPGSTSVPQLNPEPSRPRTTIPAVPEPMKSFPAPFLDEAPGSSTGSDNSDFKYAF